MTHKSRKKLVKVHVLKCWRPLLRAEDFFYNLDILYGGLGIGKLQFLIKKEKKMFSSNFFSIFGHLSPGSVLDLDPDPYWSPTSNSGSGSGSGKNEYGSTTLPPTQKEVGTGMLIVPGNDVAR